MCNDLILLKRNGSTTPVKSVFIFVVKKKKRKKYKERKEKEKFQDEYYLFQCCLIIYASNLYEATIYTWMVGKEKKIMSMIQFTLIENCILHTF